MSENEFKVEVERDNRPKGSIPPMHSGKILYDESVTVSFHTGDEGNTDNEKVAHVNIYPFWGAKDKGWKVIEFRSFDNGQIYVRLERD